MNRMDLKVMSISGSRDGLATPEKIAANKPKLPPHTRYVEIDGGDPRLLRRLRRATRGRGRHREPAGGSQAVIVKATLALLASIPPPPKRR